jgi:hypothetical protein
MMAMQEGWPEHQFEPGGPTDDPDPVCHAMLHTGIPEVHGYDHWSECGYRRSEH